ncbi:MAG TPA: glycosyltransferase [Thermoplasmata archaeon]|nr:glycosyltransferase [Thermoplasmata archaeon]
MIHPTASQAARFADRGTAILFIPDTEVGQTSERTPTILRTLREQHRVIGLRGPWDRILYDPRRSKAARAMLYVVDKALLVWRGLRLARGHRVRVILCETVHHAVAGVLIARLLGIRCVWDSHGNGKLFYESLEKSRTSVRLIAWLERFLGRRVDALITVSSRDAAAYAQMGLEPSKVHVIPVSVHVREIDSSAPPEDGETGVHSRGPVVLLLFGSFGYAPNREALDFVNDVLAPALARTGVRCEIQVAGRDIPAVPFDPLVRPLGFVPNIYASIRAATLCIVPVKRGVGVLTKVLDAMTVGTPIVMSDFAARGIPEIRHGVHAFVATTDEEFLRYVTQALGDPDTCLAMARRARELVERKFDWETHADRLEAIIDPSTREIRAEAAYES